LGTEVWKNEGLRGFWRGNGANVVRVFPSRGILFWTNDIFKSAFEDAIESTTLRSFLAGSFAGIAACFSTYPLDLARTRITAQVNNMGPAAKRYVSIRGTILSTVRREGIWALYRGMGPTLMGALPYEGIKFGCYDVLKQKLPDGIFWQLYLILRQPRPQRTKENPALYREETPPCVCTTKEKE
jgi:hypothetical protein